MLERRDHARDQSPPESGNVPSGMTDERTLFSRFSLEITTRRTNSPLAVTAIAPSAIRPRKVLSAFVGERPA